MDSRPEKKVTAPKNPRPDRRARMVWTFWGVMIICVIVWQVIHYNPIEKTSTKRKGLSVESYGFSLTPTIVDTRFILSTGYLPEDMPKMTKTIVEASAVEEVNKDSRRRGMAGILEVDDLVIGVLAEGESRAYPVRMMARHKVVCDELGEVPIVVTYDPLCASSAVFDRRVAGQTLEFAATGLVFNSNLLMYDVRDERPESSLWSQLDCRAICGPLTRSRLRFVNASVVPWREWVGRYPNTTVLLPEDVDVRDYDMHPYLHYEAKGEILYPVEYVPTEKMESLMTEIVAIRLNGIWTIFPLSQIAGNVDSTGRWSIVLNDVLVTFTYIDDPSAVWVTADAPPTDFALLRCYWFSWYATRGD